MKRIYYLIVLLCLMFFLFTSTYANIHKWIRVGKYQCYIVDSGDERSGQKKGVKYYYHKFIDYIYYSRGFTLGARDWTDEDGNILPFKVSQVGSIMTDEALDIMPVPDDEGITIRRYMRYQPPNVTVDGYKLDDPFPFDKADEVNPDIILGTADVMVESWINTSIGVTIHQRVIGWNQTHHDDYVIHIFTLKNTGNTDLDDDIELPNQTLKDFYFLRQGRSCKHHGRPRGSNWHSYYGEHMADSLRVAYWYSSVAPGATYDSFGNIEKIVEGFPVNPEYTAETFLHVDTSPSDPTNDPSQPQMTDCGDTEIQAFKPSFPGLSSEQLALIYQVMQYGFVGYYPEDKYMDDPDIYPGTHHAVRLDETGLKYPDEPWGRGHISWFTSCGPYTLAPGDEITIIRASVVGCISPEKGWEVGRAWANGTAKDNPPPGCTWNNGNPIDNLPPPFKMYPEFYNSWGDDSENNWAKDCWVATGKDSLFQNAWAAQWAFENDYNVPIPPPPPSLEINSRPDRIEITWGNESESASDFAGYRVYRASGDYYYDYDMEGDIVVGDWKLIFECGEGTANALTHSYDDATAERGKAYFYYVTAFDDGVQNEPGVNGKRESLESGQYLNMTTSAAYLTKPAGTLSSVRVVPNPFNINAEALQYPGEPDKIMFLDIPGYCTIKIYSESGDLVKTLYHTSGSGDESWGRIIEQHSATDTGQIIVSGIYIAVIIENDAEGNPTGNSTAVKFVVVR